MHADAARSPHAALALPGCLIGTLSWQAVAADSTGQASSDTTQPLQLAQPNWYFTNEDQRAASIREAPPNTPAAPLAQPTFISPDNSNIPAVLVPLSNGNNTAATTPATNPPPATTPAATATSNSRWRTMLQQVFGTSTPPANSQPYADAQLPRSIVPLEDVTPPQNTALAAAPTAAPPTPPNLATGRSASQAGGNLFQQVTGTIPVPAPPATSRSSSPLPAQVARVSTPAPALAANQVPIPVIPWDVAHVGGELLQQVTGTIPAPAAPISPSATSPESQVPSQPIAASATQPTNRTNEVTPAAYASPAPAVANPQPAIAHAPQPAQAAAPPVGDPFLNKLADIATTQSSPNGAVASLWQPIFATQGTPPSMTKTATANASPYPMTSTPNSILPSVPAATASAPPQNKTLEDSFFLQPFYQTNTRPSTGGNAASGSNQSPSTDLNSIVASPFGGLLRQFTLSTTDDLRKPPAQAADIAMQPDQNTWDGGWTASSPSTRGSSEAANAALVAYLQESEAIPEPIPADLDVRTGESVQPGQGGAAAGNAAQGDSLAQAERLGEEPEDTSLQFLRTATVLLEPGESQYDVGINYSLAEIDFPLLLTDGVNIVSVADATFRVRQLTVPIDYRMGITKRVQGFIGVPLGWANTQVSIGDTEAHNNDGGLGDVNFGLTMQLVDAAVDSPYWVGTLSATAPTGGDPFSNLAGISPSAPSLGQGFWSIQGNLLLIQPYDPIVIFYGVGMERFFDSEYRNIEIRPGAQYSYSLGVGFAVNDRVTLSSRFRGAYQEETEADGDRIIGSNAEPMTLRFSATISKPCNRIVEPFVEFGLTDDSVSSFFGVTWTFQPGKNKPEAKQASAANQANGEKKK